MDQTGSTQSTGSGFRSTVKNTGSLIWPDAHEFLTELKWEVLNLLVKGNTSAEIARQLIISPRTVEVHRANIMHKLDITSQIDLIRYAI